MNGGGKVQARAGEKCGALIYKLPAERVTVDSPPTPRPRRRPACLGDAGHLVAGGPSPIRAKTYGKEG